MMKDMQTKKIYIAEKPYCVGLLMYLCRNQISKVNNLKKGNEGFSPSFLSNSFNNLALSPKEWNKIIKMK